MAHTERDTSFIRIGKVRAQVRRLTGCGMLTAFLLTSCRTTAPQAAAPLVSVPRVQVAQDPWQEAEAVAGKIPNSTLMVGQGESMLPLYPSGTVLVLQRLQWVKLCAGMTVAYEPSVDEPYHVIAHVLVKKRAAGWETRGINNDETDSSLMAAENYLGTVVAAFRKSESNEAKRTLVSAAGR